MKWEGYTKYSYFFVNSTMENQRALLCPKVETTQLIFQNFFPRHFFADCKIEAFAYFYLQNLLGIWHSKYI